MTTAASHAASFLNYIYFKNHNEVNGWRVRCNARITAHVIWLALMMVIKNSCVPVSFPANTQEQKNTQPPSIKLLVRLQFTVKCWNLFCWSFASTLSLVSQYCWHAVLIWKAHVDRHQHVHWEKCLSFQSTAIKSFVRSL